MLNNIINSLKKHILNNNKNIQKYNDFINNLNIQYKNTLNNINNYFKNISKNTNNKLYDSYCNILCSIDKKYLSEKTKAIKIKKKLIHKNYIYDILLKLCISKKKELKFYNINKKIIEKTKYLTNIVNIINIIDEEIIHQNNKEKKNILEQLKIDLDKLKNEYSTNIENKVQTLDKYIIEL